MSISTNVEASLVYFSVPNNLSGSVVNNQVQKTILPFYTGGKHLLWNCRGPVDISWECGLSLWTVFTLLTECGHMRPTTSETPLSPDINVVFRDLITATFRGGLGPVSVWDACGNIFFSCINAKASWATYEAPPTKLTISYLVFTWTEMTCMYLCAHRVSQVVSGDTFRTHFKVWIDELDHCADHLWPNHSGRMLIPGLSSLWIIRGGEGLTDHCSLTSLDGYSTIDQRDKDCKYKAVDGSVDLTEQEPLKVNSHLSWSPGRIRGNNDVSLEILSHPTLMYCISLFLWWSLLEGVNPMDSLNRQEVVILYCRLPQLSTVASLRSPPVNRV